MLWLSSRDKHMGESGVDRWESHGGSDPGVLLSVATHHPFPLNTLLLFISVSTFYCYNIKKKKRFVTLLLLIFYLFGGSDLQSRYRTGETCVWGGS